MYYFYISIGYALGQNKTNKLKKFKFMKFLHFCFSCFLLNESIFLSFFVGCLLLPQTHNVRKNLNITLKTCSTCRFIAVVKKNWQNARKN